MYEEVRDCWCFKYDCDFRTCKCGSTIMCDKPNCAFRDSGVEDLIESSRSSKHEKCSWTISKFGLEQQGRIW